MDLSTDDEKLKMEIMEDIFEYLNINFKEGTNSNKTGSMMHKLIKEKTGCSDPYFKEKIEGNEIALIHCAYLIPSCKPPTGCFLTLNSYVDFAESSCKCT